MVTGKVQLAITKGSPNAFPCRIVLPCMRMLRDFHKGKKTVEHMIFCQFTKVMQRPMRRQRNPGQEFGSFFVQMNK